MTRRLDADLARWEAGELTLDDLRRLHPGEDVAGLAALHQQLNLLVEEPTPDPTVAWAALAARLPVAPSPAIRRRPRRAVVAGIIASALAVPTVAYAAAPDAVRSVVREVQDLLPGGTDHDPALRQPGTTEAPPATAVEADDDAPPAPTVATPPASAGAPPIQPTDADDDSGSEPSDIDAPDEAPDDIESQPDGQPVIAEPDDSSDTETDDPAIPDEAEPEGDASGSGDLVDLGDTTADSADELDVTDD